MTRKRNNKHKIKHYQKSLKSSLDDQIALDKKLKQSMESSTLDKYNGAVSEVIVSFNELAQNIPFAREQALKRLKSIFTTGTSQSDAKRVINQLTDNEILLLLQSWGLVKETVSNFNALTPDLFIMIFKKILKRNILP